VPGLVDEPAWPTLRAHLLLLAMHGSDPHTNADERWRHLLATDVPGVTADPFLPELEGRLTNLTGAGFDAALLVRSAAAAGPLPDELQCLRRTGTDDVLGGQVQGAHRVQLLPRLAAGDQAVHCVGGDSLPDAIPTRRPAGPSRWWRDQVSL
jgi:hypothetical protein